METDTIRLFGFVRVFVFLMDNYHFFHIWTLFGYWENHNAVFHSFSPNFLLLKTIFDIKKKIVFDLWVIFCLVVEKILEKMKRIGFWVSNVLLTYFFNISTLFDYRENHRMVNFHSFSPDFLLLKTMFYFILFYF